MKNVKITVLALFIGFMQMGCVMVANMTEANIAMADYKLEQKMVSANDVVIVGSVRLTPAIQREVQYDPKLLKPGENASGVTTDGVILTCTLSKNIAFMGDKQIDLSNMNEVSGVIFTQGKNFITKAQAASTLYLKGFDMRIKGNGGVAANTDVLDGSYVGRFKIAVPAGARAIYIGTIEIKRDEFYQPQGYKMIDEYDTAKAEFAERFPGWELVRADVTELK